MLQSKEIQVFIERNKIIDEIHLLVENTMSNGRFRDIYQQKGAFFNKSALFL